MSWQVIATQLEDTVGYFISLEHANADLQAASLAKMADRIVSQIASIQPLCMVGSTALNAAIQKTTFTTDQQAALRVAVQDHCGSAPVTGRKKGSSDTQSSSYPETYYTEELVGCYKNMHHTWQANVKLTAQFAIAIQCPHPSNDSFGYFLAPIVDWHFGGTHKN